MTNEEKRADDLRRKAAREEGITDLAPWRLIGEEQKRWLRLVRGDNGTRVTAPRRGPTFAPASRAQRAHIGERGSIVSGERPCDGAHATPRALGGCEDPLCVIPLTRMEHRAFDDGKLDVLPYMYAHGLWEELGHAITEHHVDLLSLLQRLTGVRFVPEIREVTDEMVERGALALAFHRKAHGESNESVRAAITAALSVQNNDRWTPDREEKTA